VDFLDHDACVWRHIDEDLAALVRTASRAVEISQVDRRASDSLGEALKGKTQAKVIRSRRDAVRSGA
jgi:hypothetical protein